jgi:hypothetical protein
LGYRLRKILKFTGWSLGGVFALLAAFLALLAWPGFLFAHQLEYRSFTVYSDEDLQGRIEPILAAIGRQLSTSEIADPRLQYDFYFGHDNEAFRVMDRARWAVLTPLTDISPSPVFATGWPPHLNQMVCLDVPDPTNDALLREGWRSRLNMVHLLTHESGHLLVANRLGMQGAMQLPLWKAEGYPEYIAAQVIRTSPGYSLRSSVTRLLTANLAGFRDAQGNFLPLHYGQLGRSFLRDENGDHWHTTYYLARVMVEYSLDVRGMSFAQLADERVREDVVLRDLLADYAAGRF